MNCIRIKYIACVLCLLACVLTVLAQKSDEAVTVSGNVKDQNRNPLAGVTVLIQERTRGIETTAEGSFSFQCSPNDQIVFQKEGYNTVQKAASELNNVTVEMQTSLIDAGDNDNVYIPFGVRKKREVSATVSTIDAASLPQLPSSTLNNVLAGRLQGLYIQQTGTRPGTDDATFLVRGRSSYNSNQAPLILVDGVQRNFVDMDLNEIESISVLKDAASLSWYGMYGANGVIYVRTKRGTATRTRVTFDAQGGLQTPVIMTRPLNSYTYATLYNQAQVNSDQTPLYTDEALQAYQTGTDPYRYPNNNFTDRFIKDAAPVQRYVATISGGNAFAKYFTLLSYFNQDGLYQGGDNPSYNSNTNFQRYNFRTNIDLHVNKTLDVTLDIGGRSNSLRYPRDGNANLLNAVFNTPPNAFPLLNANGTYGGSSLFQRSNPLAMLQSRGNITDLTRSMLVTLDARQKLDFILNGLSLNLFYTYDISSAYTSGFTQDYEVYELGPDGTYSRFGTKAPLNYASSDFNSNVRNNEFWGGLDYNRTFGQHGLNFSTRVMRAVTALPASLDTHREGISNRLSYNFMHRYFADFVAAYSGSESFMPGKRFGWFPAVSAGWIVSEEGFMNPLHFIDYLKVRGSYGVVGNDAISLSRRFAYNNYFNRGGSQYFFGTGFSSVPNTTEAELGNPDLTWEKAKKASLGLDLKLFKQAVSLSADYFREDRTDLLTSDLLPDIIGQNLVQINAGEARYNGFEGSLNFHKQLNKVSLNIYGNYTTFNSKILKLNEEAGLPDYQKQTGFTIGSVVQGGSYIRKFLISEGLFQSQEEIDNAPVQRFSGVVKPGDIRYKDINGDHVIDNLDFVMTNYSDVPDTYYGFGASAAFKGFDVSFLFQGAAGRTIQINNLINSGTSATGYINQFSTESWTPETAATAKYPRLAVSDRGNNTQNSDFWLRSGDFLKLKHAEVGYTLPAKFVSSVKLSSCRIYVSGFNLLTFDKLDGFPIDPEMPEAGYNSSYPYIRTYSVGINVKF